MWEAVVIILSTEGKVTWLESSCMRMPWHARAWGPQSRYHTTAFAELTPLCQVTLSHTASECGICKTKSGDTKGPASYRHAVHVSHRHIPLCSVLLANRKSVKSTVSQSGDWGSAMRYITASDPSCTLCVLMGSIVNLVTYSCYLVHCLWTRWPLRDRVPI